MTGADHTPDAPAAAPAAGAPGAAPGPGVAPGSVPGSAAGDADAGLGEPDLAEAVLSDLDVLQRERDEYLDSLRRLQADFENFRKRTVKQQTEHLERAAQGLVEKLLPVLDAADLAVAHGGADAVGQVAGLLMDILAKEGLVGVDPKPGDPFDPTFHEAVAHEPGDSAHQEVSGLLRAGYLWKGTLLRPAMVKVRG